MGDSLSYLDNLLILTNVLRNLSTGSTCTVSPGTLICKLGPPVVFGDVIAEVQQLGCRGKAVGNVRRPVLKLSRVVVVINTN